MGWISGLSEKGRRVWEFLLRGIREGLSGREILDRLREKGLGYRLQDFYNDLRILKGEVLKHETMKYVPRGKIISERLYTPTERLGKWKFITVVEVKYRDPYTEEEGVGYVSVGHDAPMRREDIEYEAIRSIRRKGEEYRIPAWVEILSVMPVGGYRRATW